MSTRIEWCDETWSPVTGCTPISEGCENCYARRMATRLRGRCGYPKVDPFYLTFHPDRLRDPLRWRKPRRVFVCSMGDLFHEKVFDMDIDDVFAAMALTPRHTYMLLTKRPDRMGSYFDKMRLSRISQAAEHRFGESAGCFVYNYIHGCSMPKEIPNDGNPCNGTVKRWPLPNVWLGVTAENQQRADERIPVLLQIPAAVRFVSVEPMLGPIDFGDDFWESGNRLDWVICGGETGPGARPCEKAWVDSLSDQCHEARVPFFAKKFGWKAEGPMARREFPSP